MQTKYFNFFKFLSLVLIGVILVSCSLERKIAKNYVSSDNQPSVLLFFPEEIIKSNLKTELALSDNKSKLLDQDSIIKANDLFLHLIDDSVFMNLCKQSLIKELSAYGMKVYEPDQIDEVIANPDTTFVLSMVQMQLEEYKKLEKLDGHVDLRYYSQDFTLNAINLNTWFELSHSKITSEKFPVLYSSYFIFDDLDGSYVAPQRFSERVSLFYKVDTMGIADINNLAELAGKKYAINFYDYLLNIYVQDHLPKDKIPVFYYHYNRKAKSLQTNYYDAFTEIDPNF